MQHHLAHAAAILTFLPLLTSAAPSPLRKLVSWSSEHTYQGPISASQHSTCFYDKVKEHSGQCPLSQSNPYPGYPDPSLCDQARDAVCRGLSLLEPGNSSVIFAHVGDGKLQGNNTDCYAIGHNGEDPDYPMGQLDTTDGEDRDLRYQRCQERFRDIQVCSEPRNAGYNHQCAGGSIDEGFTPRDYKRGRLLKPAYRKPRFGMGSPQAFGIVDADHSTIKSPEVTRELKGRSEEQAFVRDHFWGDEWMEGDDGVRDSMPRRGLDSSRNEELYERWKEVSAAADGRDVAPPQAKLKRD